MKKLTIELEDPDFHTLELMAERYKTTKKYIAKDMIEQAITSFAGRSLYTWLNEEEENAENND